jgi:hypothetical protein
LIAALKGEAAPYQNAKKEGQDEITNGVDAPLLAKSKDDKEIDEPYDAGNN